MKSSNKGNLLEAVSKSLASRADKDVFAIGGAVEKPEPSPEKPTPTPLAIRWDRDDQGQCRKLLLPVADDDAASQASLDMILKDCDPATFGIGNKEVLDEEYRKAGKLDSTRFSTSFDLGEHGLLDTVNQALAQGGHPDALGVRAEMYKLNVYSGPSGKFKSHVDTPRSDRQMGSLVVCLPVPHKGGQLVVRHGDRKVDFDWGPKSADTIQWAAFFSDCKHEVLQVTEGHRMTLTYNLFWTSYGPASMADNLGALDQESLHFFSALEKLFACEDFLREGMLPFYYPFAFDADALAGGLVGFTCTHAYPHSSSSSMENLHHTLKGIDMVVYQALKRLLGSASVTAVVDDKNFKQVAEDEGQTGLGKFKGYCISSSLQPAFTCDLYDERKTPDPATYPRLWREGPAFPRQAVTWLNHAPDSQSAKELAFAFITYGNEPGVDAYYSSAVIMGSVKAKVVAASTAKNKPKPKRGEWSSSDED